MANDSKKAVVSNVGGHRFFYGYIIVAAAFIILMTVLIIKCSYGVFFGPLINEFNWSRTIISGASALNDIAFGGLCVVTAKLCEKFNPRLIVSICGLFLGLGCFLMSRLDSVWQLYLYYGILIAFSMSVFIALVSIVARWFVKRRGLMTGVVLSGLGLASTIGPPVTNWLITTYDWRQAILVLGITAMAVIVLAAQFLKRDPQQVRQLPYGASLEGNHSIGVSGLSLSEALRTRQLWHVCGMYFAFCFCYVVVMVHIVIHGIDTGLTPASAANILAIFGIVSVAGLYIMGTAGDRFGNRRILAICFLLLAICFSWLLFASNLYQFIVFAVIFGLTWGGLQVLFSPLVADLFGLRSHGVILGVGNFGGAIGAAVGPLLAGYMFDKTGSYSVAFTICIALAIIAIVLTSLLRALPQAGQSITIMEH